MSRLAVAFLVSFAALVVSPVATAQVIEATTPTGDKVLLHPDGRWEYVDARKAAEARKVAEQFPEDQGCPPGSQGGLFGVGRCIKPGDPDYNRGTLNPAKR